MKIFDIISEHRDAWQRDYDSSVSGMGKHQSLAYQLDGGANDEGWDREEPRQHRQPAADIPHDVYIDGRKWKTFGSHSHANNVARKLQSNGKKATVVKSTNESLSEMDKSQKGPPGWNISDDEPGGKEYYVKSVKAKDFAKSAGKVLNKSMKDAHKKTVKETASAGATSAASIGTVVNPHISPGKARGKKSYTGTPGHSGTKAPPQPKVVQPKTSAGTAVNGLDIKGKSLFGGPANESAVIKRR